LGGTILATPDERGSSDSGDLREARLVASAWRSAHAFPLGALQNGLRQHVRKVCDDAVVSHRLKRIPSTIAKRMPRPAA